MSLEPLFLLLWCVKILTWPLSNGGGWVRSISKAWKPNVYDDCQVFSLVVNCSCMYVKENMRMSHIWFEYEYLSYFDDWCTSFRIFSLETIMSSVIIYNLHEMGCLPYMDALCYFSWKLKVEDFSKSTNSNLDFMLFYSITI